MITTMVVILKHHTCTSVSNSEFKYWHYLAKYEVITIIMSYSWPPMSASNYFGFIPNCYLKATTSCRGRYKKTCTRSDANLDHNSELSYHINERTIPCIVLKRPNNNQYETQWSSLMRPMIYLNLSHWRDLRAVMGIIIYWVYWVSIESTASLTSITFHSFGLFNEDFQAVKLSIFHLHQNLIILS